MEEISLQRNGEIIGVTAFGGTGPSVLLLHGLAGSSAEWLQTGEWLPARGRAVGIDTRGHGRSERRPADVSVEAQVRDCVFAIAELELDRVVVVGQSVGGIVAMHLAAHRPDLVEGLVVVEADPEPDDPASINRVESWLRSWPVPFGSREEAMGFFGGTPGSAAAWTAGLEQHADGLRPSFKISVLVELLAEASAHSNWSAWERVQCPTLVVRGARGHMSKTVAASMIDRGQAATLVEVAEAGHDVHLDEPGAWRVILEGFLDKR